MSDSPHVDAGNEPLSRTQGFDELAPGSASWVDPPGLIGLEVVGGPMDGESARTQGQVATLGRSEDNDLVLGLDPAVSTRHARITREGAHLWLEDLGSRNGTFIGDQRIRERVLVGPGTIFRVGRTRIELSSR